MPLNQQQMRTCAKEDVFGLLAPARPAPPSLHPLLTPPAAPLHMHVTEAPPPTPAVAPSAPPPVPSAASAPAPQPAPTPTAPAAAAVEAPTLSETTPAQTSRGQLAGSKHEREEISSPEAADPLTAQAAAQEAQQQPQPAPPPPAQSNSHGSRPTSSGNSIRARKRQKAAAASEAMPAVKELLKTGSSELVCWDTALEAVEAGIQKAKQSAAQPHQRPLCDSRLRLLYSRLKNHLLDCGLLETGDSPHLLPERPAGAAAAGRREGGVASKKLPAAAAVSTQVCCELPNTLGVLCMHLLV